MKKYFVGIIGLAVLGAVIFLGSDWLKRQPSPSLQKYNGPTESLSIGIVKEYATLVLLAKRQDFFRNNGLDVSTVEFTSGATSLQGLADGQVDIATASDFSGVSKMFKDNSFKVLTGIFDSPAVFLIVARRDHGITTPADLRGKKIGLTKSTMGEFFLGAFLTSHGLALSDVDQVDGDAVSLAEKINKGTVDAVINFQPYSYEIEKSLANNAVVFPTQGNQLLYANLYASQEVISQRPGTLKRFVSALSQAEEFARDHPAEVKSFFSEQFHYEDDYIHNVLSKFSFRLSLSQEMLIAMEDEARWSIENKLTDKTRVPNYLNLIYLDALKSVKPGAVSITK